MNEKRETKSFAMSEPSLREKAPSSLKKAQPIREKFCAVNDQTKSDFGHQEQAQTDWQSDERRGSKMVEDEKPFPELKPDFADAVKRNSFDEKWLSEQRAAKLKEFECAKEHEEPIAERSTRSYER